MFASWFISQYLPIYTVLDGRMIVNKLRRMWKEMVVVYFKVLF